MENVSSLTIHLISLVVWMKKVNFYSIVKHLIKFYLGKGAVYSFDPVGSFEREKYRAGGSAASLIQPLLDSQIGKKNRTDADSIPEYTLEEAVQITKDAFTSAAERDIYTGDFVEIWKITATGMETELFPLRRD